MFPVGLLEYVLVTAWSYPLRMTFRKQILLVSVPKVHYFAIICTLLYLPAYWRQKLLQWLQSFLLILLILVFTHLVLKRWRPKNLIKRYIELALKKYFARCSNKYIDRTWWQQWVHLYACHTEKFQACDTDLHSLLYLNGSWSRCKMVVPSIRSLLFRFPPRGKARSVKAPVP